MFCVWRRGMSYKSALAGIGFGGGKSVVLCDPKKKNPELMRAFAEFVESFHGRYITAMDMNVSNEDLLEIRKVSRHVLGMQGHGSSGDPSPVTARGIFRGLEATVEELTGSRSLKGLKVAIQGIGHVGYRFADLVVKAGGKIWVTDINPEALRRAEKELGAVVVESDALFELEVDILSPCARGAILNEKTIPRLKCKAVVGCANNQLATSEDGYRLQKRGILYAPDFAINSGGIINIFVEYEGYNEARALEMADAIYQTTQEIYKRSKQSGQPTFIIADKLAEERLDASP